MKPQNPTRICVSVCEQNIESLKRALTRASSVSDLIEVRADCLKEIQSGKGFADLDQALAESNRPAVVTYRPVEQGGRRALDARSRLFFWLFKRPSKAELFDIELDIVRNEALFSEGNTIDWARVICSYHSFSGASGDLNRIYDSMKDTRAGILKIAARVTDITECLEFFHLLQRARNDGRELIPIAMGPAGTMTRILGPSQGAFLTYASLDDEKSTAPGQITASELRELYRIHKIGPETQILGVVGNPVLHSLSPHMHNAGFQSSGFNAIYLPFEVRDLDSFLKRMVRPTSREVDLNFRGLSVTAPYKAAIAEYLDWIDPVALKIGAVNTVVVEKNELHGYNTDAGALVEPLLSRFGELRNKRCAILGSGGAASAAVWALNSEGALTTLFARNREKGRALANRFQVQVEELESARFEGFDVVLNATPLGTSGELQNKSPANAEQLQGALLAYDLVYNPGQTLFLSEARVAGCETLGGIDMLLGQAASQFKLWTGMTAPREVMAEAAIQKLRAN